MALSHCLKESYKRHAYMALKSVSRSTKRQSTRANTKQNAVYEDHFSIHFGDCGY